MPMKLKNYKKQPILIFAQYNFLVFLDTQLHEQKISEKTISEIFGNGVGVLVFSGEVLGSFLLIPPPSSCIKFVVSHFLIVIGNIIANYR